jgi:hypothetical protein
MTEIKDSLENIEIRLHETKKGQLFVSFQHDGKHYIAFFNEFQNTDGNNTWIIRQGHIRLCRWDKCRYCYPDEVII